MTWITLSSMMPEELTSMADTTLVPIPAGSPDGLPKEDSQVGGHPT